MREPVMEGRGYYNKHSEVQARSAEEADGVLERALAAVAIPPGPVTIADFGSSQGHNSMRQPNLALFPRGPVTVSARLKFVLASMSAIRKPASTSRLPQKTV